MKDLKDGIRSQVRIDFKGNVHKKFRGHERSTRCENEARILKALEERECPYVPRLLEYLPEEDYLVTSNCGQPAPDISRTKSDALFSDLEREYGVRHDDPEPRNVTYSSRLGRFCLIDFELAELLPRPGGVRQNQCGVWRVNWSSVSEGGTKRDSNDDAYLALEVCCCWHRGALSCVACARTITALRSVHANDIEVVRLRPIPPGQPKERFFRIL